MKSNNIRYLYYFVQGFSERMAKVISFWQGQILTSGLKTGAVFSNVIVAFDE